MIIEHTTERERRRYGGRFTAIFRDGEFTRHIRTFDDRAEAETWLKTFDPKEES